MARHFHRHPAALILSTAILLHCAVGNETIAEAEPGSCLDVDLNRSCLSLKREFENGVLYVQKTSEVRHCPGDYVLPLFLSEDIWNQSFRAFLYFVGLCYCFLGVAMISDTFMAAIEVITSREKLVTQHDKDGNIVETTVLAWNETMANLTLMALGSSAPEILLAIVEAVGTLDKPPRNGLGPSTIVGSAAFNLMFITGICILAIPDGEKREIEKLGVFNCTAAFSLLAYVWMWYVLVVWSPEEIRVEEAVITLLCMFILLFFAYAQDKQWWNLCSQKSAHKVKPEEHILGFVGNSGEPQRFKQGRMHALMEYADNPEAVADLLRRKAKDGETFEDASQAATQAMSEIEKKSKVSRMRYRINAIRFFSGRRRVIPRKIFLRSTKEEEVEDSETKGATEKATPEKKENQEVLKHEVNFASSQYDVHESAGKVAISVIRTGPESAINEAALVSYETSNGSAMAGEDFEYTSGRLHFAAGETEKKIEIQIVDDNNYEPDESFYVAIKAPCENVTLGPVNITEVTIIDDDSPGLFTFEKGAVVVRETDGDVNLTICRKNGVDGEVKLYYSTVEISAKAGKDFYNTSGTVVFKHGESKKDISVHIIDGLKYEEDSTFAVQFEIPGHPNCGADYGEHKTTIVTITSNENFQAVVDQVSALMKINLEKLEVGSLTWTEQFRSALTYEGEEGVEPALFDLFMHVVVLGWKILFAFVPPTSYFNGWLTFWSSLAVIGLLTMIIGDLATIFGCLLHMPNVVTAITFVALGTSLPDTFASVTAARSDDNADASIGNVTGSNSVNVFLGLGLPWLISSLYHYVKGTPGGYRVDAGDLTASVFYFLICASSIFGLIYFRRFNGYGELGKCLVSIRQLI